MRIVPAGEFKAKCLSLLDDVAKSGVELVVTKRGRPVARVLPVESPRSLAGSVHYDSEEHLLAPVGDAWDAP